MLVCVNTDVCDLNFFEKEMISIYMEYYGRDMMYNIAKGGDGGDTYSGHSNEWKLDFKEKMTTINRERCNTENFKNRLSRATSERYKDPEKRKSHSEKVRKAWSNEELKKRHSEILKEYFKEHPRDCSFAFKPCRLILNDLVIDFESTKALSNYLETEFNFSPGGKGVKRIIEDSERGIPYQPFHKNKLKRLYGLRIIHIKKEDIQDKAVEAMGDECNPAG